jgi:hypothetical protein
VFEAPWLALWLAVAAFGVHQRVSLARKRSPARKLAKAEAAEQERIAAKSPGTTHVTEAVDISTES